MKNDRCTVLIKRHTLFFRYIPAFLFIFFMFFSGGSALADQFHYNNLLIGDRASGMGGAYTAVSDDATGLYYNPAGIVYSSGRNLSASVNAYYNLSKKYDGVIGSHGWERTSSALLPNFFGIVQPLGKLKFGFSYAVPDSINEDQDQTFYNVNATVKSYIINFNNEDNTYNVGPSLALELSKSVSSGLTLYVHQRRAQMILNQIVNMAVGSGYEWQNNYFQIDESGIRPLFGFMWSPVDKLSLGVSVSRTIVLKSTTTNQFSYSTTVPALINPTGMTSLNNNLWRNDISSNEKKIYPVQMNLGAAYFASNNVLLTADLAYFGKVTDPNFGDREAVLNAAMGTEYFFSRNWALRGGMFTNFASTPDIQSGIPAVAEEHIDMYGGTLSLSHFTKNTSVTLGGSIASGKGLSQISSDLSTQNASALGWTVALSSTYSY